MSHENPLVHFVTLRAGAKHLGIAPFAYLRGALPRLFAMGEKPTTEQLLDRLPDR